MIILVLNIIVWNMVYVFSLHEKMTKYSIKLLRITEEPIDNFSSLYQKKQESEILWEDVSCLKKRCTRILTMESPL